ncbi:MAG: rRNA pseudouridine synthase [Xanthomonadales bacterium]|nr:rRNA pseudouridine synthase [Xanthomonadales bacterium]MCP5474376.1 rRNA pseudouridine synthase [Rhodanobacteraceae bacterium]
MSGLARHLSKLGVCSRSVAAQWVRAGRVSINGRAVLDPECPVPARARIEIDGAALTPPRRVYLMLNKPRGLVTSANDEQGRDTVYRCLEGLDLPWVAPVGRLDKASEGLLLLSNDPEWAARITDPDQAVLKHYHVQIDRVPDEAQLARLRVGVVDREEHLSAVQVELLRSGGKTAWLAITLDEGRNRQIRRLLQAQGIGTLRLIRVGIGGLVLGDLAKGKLRELKATDLARLSPQAAAHAP